MNWPIRLMLPMVKMDFLLQNVFRRSISVRLLMSLTRIMLFRLLQ